jgi:hypothetical protein
MLSARLRKICIVNACLSWWEGSAYGPALEYYQSLLLGSILEQLFRELVVHVENLAIRILNSNFLVTYF